MRRPAITARVARDRARMRQPLLRASESSSGVHWSDRAPLRRIADHGAETSDVSPPCQLRVKSAHALRRITLSIRFLRHADRHVSRRARQTDDFRRFSLQRDSGHESVMAETIRPGLSEVQRVNAAFVLSRFDITI